MSDKKTIPNFEHIDDALTHFFANPMLSGGGKARNWDNFKSKILDKQQHLKINKKDFEERDSNRESTQVNFQIPKPKQFLPIFSKNDNSFQVDLTGVNNYTDTHGNKYLFTAVDVNSRQAYAYALKSKDNEHVDEVIERFLRDVHAKTGAPVYSITTDIGSEFVDGNYKAVLEKHGVQIYYANKEDKTKMGKIERFNRTIKEMFMRILPESDETWSDVLPDIIENYNTSKHRALGHAPDDYNAEDKEKQYTNYKRKYETILGSKEDVQKELAPETTVRIRLRHGLLTKKSEAFKNSPTLYKISKTYPSGTVELKDPLGNVMKDKQSNTRFKPYDLYKIKDPSKIIIHTGQNTIHKFFEKQKQIKIDKKVAKEVNQIKDNAGLAPQREKRLIKPNRNKDFDY